MNIIKFLSSQDAVSEALDFVALLGILVISIGLIGVAGYPILKNVQEANHIENTKQSFIVLAENINKVVLGQAPSQSVELKMYGGTLSVNMSSTITVNLTVYNQSNTPPYDNIAFSGQGSVESNVGNIVIAYEGTGVWAKYPNGNTLMISKPLITNESKLLVIPVITIRGASSIGGTGMGWVTVCTNGCLSSVYPKTNVSNITVTINSSYSDGWYNYFNNSLSWYCPTPASWSSVTCTAPLAKNVDVYVLNVWLDTEVV